MSLKINQLGVNRDVCDPVFPNQPVWLGVEIHEIAPTLWTACGGHRDTPQWVEVCAVECIIIDPDHAQSRQRLLAKYATLAAERKP